LWGRVELEDGAIEAGCPEAAAVVGSKNGEKVGAGGGADCFPRCAAIVGLEDEASSSDGPESSAVGGSNNREELATRVALTRFPGGALVARSQYETVIAYSD
jgi:hypothetical protein